MSQLERVLGVFALGFLAIGLVLGFQGVGGGCGSVFHHPGGCSSALSGHVALVIAFVGTGLTSAIASVIATVSGAGPHRADQPGPRPDRRPESSTQTREGQSQQR